MIDTLGLACNDKTIRKLMKSVRVVFLKNSNCSISAKCKE
jgi:hypothetical protein